MNATIEKINNINISESKIEKTKEDEKKPSSKDQFCLKALDYFVF
jgi:hypothetical protein